MFQDGHLSGVLGFTPRPMDMAMTVLLFGIGCGLAILIDATLVRGILVPASMRLLGPAVREHRSTTPAPAPAPAPRSRPGR